MANGPEQYTAAERLIDLGIEKESALLIRAGEARAMLAVAASNIAVATQGKTVTTLSTELQAWTKATASTGALPTVSISSAGRITVAKS